MFGLITKFFKSSAAKRQDPFASAPREENSPLPAAASSAGLAEPESVSVPGDSASLSYTSILEQVPKELHGRITASGLAGFNFSISKKKVLEQLPQGSVKVSFGELRHAAPAGVFINSSSHDGKLIDLPLRDIMVQLQAELFARNLRQKRLETPTDIADLFSCKGEPLGQMRVLEKSESARATPVASPAPAALPAQGALPTKTALPAKAASPTMAAPAARIPFSGASAPAGSSAPIPFPKPGLAATPAVQAQKQKASSGLTQTAASESAIVVSLASLADNWPEAIRKEIQQLGLSDATCEIPAGQVGPALRAGKVQYLWKQIRSWIRPSISSKKASPHGETNLELPLKIIAPLYLQQCRSTLSTKKVSVTQDIPDVFNKVEKRVEPPPPAASALPAVAASVASASEESSPDADASAPDLPGERPPFLTLPLSLVSETWPDQLRKEVERFNLVDAKLDVPFDVIEEGLKRGKLHFRWKEVCSWLKPAAPAAMTSANLETQLDYRVDLPLNFVAPLFLRFRPAPIQKRSSALGHIPDLFSATSHENPAAPAIPEPGPAVSAQVQAPAASEEKVSDTKIPKKPGEELAELFGEPEKRNWTPNDIVHKTSTLPGVAGALIALQDGLLVATCMPPTWKTETIAAFLPQIFGRMSQYTTELKMGELRSVTFSVDEGSLQVFNAGIIYFAALGSLGAPLPIRELNLIVKEISRHTK